MNSEKFMHLALCEARRAYDADEVPVGAVIVRDGEVISAAANKCRALGDPTAHAEMLAIKDACEKLGVDRLGGCTMYVTLEPCPMCSGAILLSRLDKVVFGAYEEKFGAVGTKYNLFYDYTFNHDVKFCGGVLEDECKKLMQAFFETKRGSQN